MCNFVIDIHLYPILHIIIYIIIVLVKLPRYARVNSLKTEMIQVEEELTNCGYELVCQKDFRSHHLPSCGGPCTCSSFCKDEHIPNLLAFCPCASLTSTKLYASGHIIIQDKVICEDTPQSILVTTIPTCTHICIKSN